MMHDGYGGFWGMGWFWWILILIIFIAVIFFIYQANRPKPPRDYQTRQSAMEILEERYARGEISKEEYREKKKDLTER